MIQGRMKAGMTLGFAYETGLALATTLALLAVLPAQTVPSWLWISLLIPPLAAYLHRHSKTLGSGVTTLAGFLILLIASAFGIQGGLSVLVEVMTATLIGFLALRLLSRNEPRHDIQALLMGFLLFLAGSILQPTLVYGLLFIAFSLAVIWALLTHNLVTGGLFREEELSEDEKESIKKHVLARRDIITPRFLSIVAVLALLILASTVVLFASFPRIGFGRFGFSRQRGISLPQSVSLGGGSMAGGSGEVVARIYGLSYARFERGLYLRGPVFDILKKEGFSRSHKDIAGAPSQLGLHPQGEPFEYEVFLQPVTTKILPILGPSRGVFVIRGGKLHPSMPIRTIGVNAYSEVLTAEPLRGPVRYKINGYFSENGAASGLLNSFSLTTSQREHFLKLPSDQDPRILDLVNELLSQKQKSHLKAAVFSDYLRNNFEYSLAQPNAFESDPLAAFLFDDRRGHCEYFAIAYATLLRQAGIPARVVGGYAGGIWDPKDKIALFRSSDAHAWVEYFTPESGWIQDDATPASTQLPQILTGLAAWIERMERRWDDNIVDYGLSHQLGAIESVYLGLKELGKGDQKGDLLKFRNIPSWVFWLVAAIIGLAFSLWQSQRLRSFHFFGRRVQHDQSLILAHAIIEAIRKQGLLEEHYESQTMRTIINHCLTNLSSETKSREASDLLVRSLKIYEYMAFAEGETSIIKIVSIQKELKRWQKS